MKTYVINIRLKDSTGEPRALVLDNIQDAVEAYFILNETAKLFINKGYELTWSQVSQINTGGKP